MSYFTEKSILATLKALKTWDSVTSRSGKDSTRCRAACSAAAWRRCTRTRGTIIRAAIGSCGLRRIIDRIARRGVESSVRLGRYRWVVERTLAWLSRYRRLTIRYGRRLDIHQAFTTLACALICWNYVQRTL